MSVNEIAGFAIFAVLLLVVAVALFCGKSVPLYPKCGGCGDPLVHGYEALVNGKTICRDCCRKHGIRPWYWKDWMGPPPTVKPLD